MSTSAASLVGGETTTVVKQGWLLKRGKQAYDVGGWLTTSSRRVHQDLETAMVSAQERWLLPWVRFYQPAQQHVGAQANTHVYRYKTGPPSPADGPLNFFDVAGSVLTVSDDGKPKGTKGKKWGFQIRYDFVVVAPWTDTTQVHADDSLCGALLPPRV